MIVADNQTDGAHYGFNLLKITTAACKGRERDRKNGEHRIITQKAAGISHHIFSLLLVVASFFFHRLK